MMVEERADYAEGVTDFPTPRTTIGSQTIDYAANVNGPWIEDGGWTAGNYLSVRHGNRSANIGFADGHAGLLSYTNCINPGAYDVSVP